MTELSSWSALEAQLRECYGRVIYTHKTHSKMADRCADTLTRVKIWQIILSALTTSGVIGVIFLESFHLKMATALVALISTALTSYMKGFDPGAAAQKHRDTAAAIWPIRESYLSLLTDAVAQQGDIADLRKRRDALQDKLAAIYKGAPHTTGAAYMAAQDALKNKEDFTFSDRELDLFLPPSLRLIGRGVTDTSTASCQLNS